MMQPRHRSAAPSGHWHNRAMDRGDEPLLTVAAVARRLGVAPATLRTWDRRYGLGPSQHPAGSHRRYGTDDLARLIVMRRLTIDGVAPVEAAHIARNVDAGGLLDPTTPPDEVAAPDAVASDALVDAALAASGSVCGLKQAKRFMVGPTFAQSCRARRGQRRASSEAYAAAPRWRCKPHSR